MLRMTAACTFSHGLPPGPQRFQWGLTEGCWIVGIVLSGPTEVYVWKAGILDACDTLFTSLAGNIPFHTGFLEQDMEKM